MGRRNIPTSACRSSRASQHIEWVKFREHTTPIGADQVAGCNGVIVLTPAVTAETVSQSRDLLAVGRFGVGYDAVDVDGVYAGRRRRLHHGRRG